MILFFVTPVILNKHVASIDNIYDKIHQCNNIVR